MAKLQLSLRVDASLLRRAQQVLRARSKTEVVERSLATVVELERHRRLILRFSGTARSDDFRSS